MDGDDRLMLEAAVCRIEMRKEGRRRGSTNRLSAASFMGLCFIPSFTASNKRSFLKNKT